MSSSPAAVPASPPPPSSSKGKRGARKSIDAYAVQCCECHKWRVIPTKDEFETVRENFIEDPWLCSRRPGCSCEDPADIEYDSSRIWVIDRPNIPKPPPNTERLTIIRRDLTNFDICCVLPNGKRARCPGAVRKFLGENPEYKDRLSVESFSFAVPRVLEDTVSDGSAWRSKKPKQRGRKCASRGRK